MPSPFRSAPSLGQADDLLRLVIAAVDGSELTQHAGQHEHLLEVAALVGVDALAEDAPQEDDRVVLVVLNSIFRHRLIALGSLKDKGRRSWRW